MKHLLTVLAIVLATNLATNLATHYLTLSHYKQGCERISNQQQTQQWLECSIK